MRNLPPPDPGPTKPTRPLPWRFRATLIQRRRARRR